MNIDDEKYTRKLTKKEYLIFTYNEILLRVVRFGIDVEFFAASAKTFKHDSPQAIEALQKSLEARDSVRNNELTLQVIDGLLTKLEKKEKSKN